MWEGFASSFDAAAAEPEPKPEPEQPEQPGPEPARKSPAPAKRRLLNDTADAAATPLLRRASAADLQRARRLVRDAMEESGRRNRARLAHPARNTYRLKPGTVTGGKTARAPDGRGPPLLLDVTPDVAAAAALVAEAEAVAMAANVSKLQAGDDAPAGGPFWVETIARKGTAPWGTDASYKVFRNVRDYGAKGEGVTDDTAAIKKAINDGRRCGKNCNGSTFKNAIVYLPAGKYLVSTSIPVVFDTQLIGDANNWPTIVASRSFIGLGILATEVYTGDGKGIDGLDQEWYVNTANFYRQIRNLRVDINTRPVQEVACIHYQVAQTTSLQFFELIAKPGTTQRGIFSENDSGSVISDVTIRGSKHCFCASLLSYPAPAIATR